MALIWRSRWSFQDLPGCFSWICHVTNLENNQDEEPDQYKNMFLTSILKEDASEKELNLVLECRKCCRIDGSG